MVQTYCMRSSSFGMPRSSDRSSGTRSRRALQQRRWHQFKQRLLTGLRWFLLLAGLGFVNAYVFYYHPKISLTAIQQNQNTTAAPPTQAAALPSHTVSPPVIPPRPTNTVLESPPPLEESGALDYFSSVETPLLPRMSLDGFLKTTTLAKSQQPAVLKALRDALPPQVTRGPKASVVVYSDENGQLLALDYHPTPQQGARVVLRPAEEATDSIRVIPLQGERTTRVELVPGNLPSTRILADALSSQESPALARLLIRAFAYDKDLQTMCRPGDRFAAIVEKEYQGDVFLRYGRLLAASYASTNEDGSAGALPLTAFWFGTQDTGGYYNEEGRSLERPWLRSPVLLPSNVLSTKDVSTFQPRWNANRNKDLAHALFPAPPGTRVQALASGTLRSCENKDLCQWMIERDGDEVIWYRNLALAKFLKAGTHVQAGQWIGTSQNSNKCPQGLCVAFWKEGRSINPLRDFPKRTLALVPERSKPQFLAAAKRYSTQLLTSTTPALASRL